MLFKWKQWVVVAPTCNANTELRKLRQEDCGELETTQDYRAKS